MKFKLNIKQQFLPTMYLNFKSTIFVLFVMLTHKIHPAAVMSIWFSSTDHV